MARLLDRIVTLSWMAAPVLVVLVSYGRRWFG